MNVRALVRPRHPRARGRTNVAGLALRFVGLALATTIVVGRAQPAFADHGALDVEIASLTVSGPDGLTAIVSVLDNGRPVAGLTAANFTAVEGQVGAPVLSVSPSESAEIPLAVIIVLDTSGSMEGSAMAASLAAASAFIAQLPPGDPAAVVSFADSAVVRRDFSTDRAALSATINALVASGNTALYDGVARSAQLAGTTTTSRRAVLLLSDGEDFGGRSATTRDESLSLAQASGAVFYTIGLGASIDAEYLQALATRSGGRYFAAPAPGDIAAIYQSLSDRLRSQYIVQLKAVDPEQGGTHTLRLAVASAGVSGEATATYERVVPTPALPSPTSTPGPSATAPAAAPVASEPGSGGLPIVPIAAVAATVLAAAVVTPLALRRRARQPHDEPAVVGKGGTPTKPVAADALSPGDAGDLWLQGPGEPGRSITVGSRPVTLGSAQDCDGVLAANPAIGRHHCRIWWRDGRLMLHHLDRSTRTMVNGAPADWVALDDGDEIKVGDYTLRYRGEPTAPASQRS